MPHPLHSLPLSSRIASKPPSATSWVISVLAIACAAPSAAAQVVTYPWHNGANSATCGPLGGPSSTHFFPDLVTTHDSIALSDPGGPQWSASDANSSLHAVLGPNGISLSNSGSANRDPLLVFGTWATADARDNWQFNLSAPTRFTLSVSLNATSSESAAGPQTFFFVGTQILPDPGSPPAPYSSAVYGTGSFTLAASGTLGPGTYLVSLAGRTEGTSFPFSGSYDNSLLLALDCGVATSYCTAKPNSLGCIPAISCSGQASSTAPSGFTLFADGVRNQKAGFCMYSIAGRAATPFQGGWLCLAPPVRRTPVLNSGGTTLPANDCTGVYSIDMNSFARGSLGGTPIPALSIDGTVVQSQFWGRDPGFPAPDNSTLSNGLEYTVCP